MHEPRARVRRLSLWFCLNLIIFVACYLNYRLQLKHRYLYKTLNVGLCFSRAAAMVINFNLLLVWLPMCKYSLTRLAYLANGSLRYQKQHHLQMVVSIENISYDQGQTTSSNESKLQLIVKKIKLSLNGAIGQLRLWFSLVKLNSINSFLIAVDHCTSLHTICATTITIASVIHTVAHLINVINFSKNFDPLLSNLNMAEYKGQNPLQLLISVPGITGTLMIIILILMSLSSVDIIRNSSYDLFQIFHRLSVIFVLLLFLHPFSHVLKEQSNVDRHHPELCYSKMITVLNSTKILTAAPSARMLPTPPKDIISLSVLIDQKKNIDYQGQFNSRAITTQQHVNNKTIDLNDHIKNNFTIKIIANVTNSGKVDNTNSTKTITIQAVNDDDGGGLESNNRFCLDPRPLFVAQSSICWYILSIGLSCYLLDLLLRKLRRSKSSIQLLDVRSDCEGNLIELILSNNHKRFSHWLPGQFVYLNCPQIATYEWHPFTISSMDNRKRQFTLHIKTGGDWTKKLREKFGCLQNSISLLNEHNNTVNNIIRSNSYPDNLILPSNLDCYNKLGQPQIVCTKLVNIKYENERNEEDCVRIDLDNNQGLSSICNNLSMRDDTNILPAKRLNLFIDGPFHSPFERLLEQQVSVCIANGVGWTAFSSVFQCITNNLTPADDSKDWWSNRRDFATNPFSFEDNKRTITSATTSKIKKLPDTKLHLMVIVTSIEQLKPFYTLALNYFKQIEDECQIRLGDQMNQVREITAFITRSTKEDNTVEEFCKQENLSTFNENHAIRVNDVFTIHFGKPKFDLYLAAFGSIYPESKKISVYCCGSYQVKKVVQEICKTLTEANKNKLDKKWPSYSYHEENF